MIDFFNSKLGSNCVTENSLHPIHNPGFKALYIIMFHILIRKTDLH